MKTFYCILFFVCFIFNDAYASTITAVPPGGDWGNAASWDGAAPGCYDTIIIPAGASINMEATHNLNGCSAVKIIIYGNLHFNQSYKLELPCGSWVLFMPGGSMTADDYDNNSKQLKICGNAVWKGKDGAVSGPGGFGGPPLPIELVYFTATLNESTKRVYLNWKTASEVDNDFFNVERSADGIHWHTILTKKAVGNSSVPLEYGDIDIEPLFGQTYYRLKQTDFDLSYSYSPIVRVNNYDLNEVELYPNPVNSSGPVVINFPKSYTQDVTLSMMSLDGRIVFSKGFEIQNSHQAILNIPENIAAGAYVINCELFTKTIVVK